MVAHHLSDANIKLLNSPFCFIIAHNTNKIYKEFFRTGYG